VSRQIIAALHDGHFSNVYHREQLMTIWPAKYLFALKADVVCFALLLLKQVMLKLQLKLSGGGYASVYCCICQAACMAVINSRQTCQSPGSIHPSINQSINLHFLSLGLIRGVNRQ
jgi:hypothetical protein